MWLSRGEFEVICFLLWVVLVCCWCIWCQIVNVVLCVLVVVFKVFIYLCVGSFSVFLISFVWVLSCVNGMLSVGFENVIVMWLLLCILGSVIMW